jgi:hypothetical protein
MTSRVDIEAQGALAKLLSLIDAGEQAVLLIRAGETVAVAKSLVSPANITDRVPGALAHLGPMDDPYIFSRPDPELEGVAEPHDEEGFHRPSSPDE